MFPTEAAVTKYYTRREMEAVYVLSMPLSDWFIFMGNKKTRQGCVRKYINKCLAGKKHERLLLPNLIVTFVAFATAVLARTLAS